MSAFGGRKLGIMEMCCCIQYRMKISGAEEMRDKWVNQMTNTALESRKKIRDERLSGE